MNSKQQKSWTIAITAVVVGLMALMGTWFGTPQVQPVQAAVITPIAQVARGHDAKYIPFFNNRVITADTRVCFDLMHHDIMDLQYIVDATLANTTTVSFQNTNTNPNLADPTPVYNAANAIATVVSTDANTFAQIGLFGRWNCVLADVTNTNPITFTIIGVAK